MNTRTADSYRRYYVRSATLLCIAAILGVAALYLFTTLVERTIIRDAERQSLTWAEYAAHRMDRIGIMASGGQPTAEDLEAISDLEKFGNVFRFKLFDQYGTLRFESDDPTASGGGLGEHNPTANAVVRSNKPYTVVADGREKPNRPDLYSETYLPVVRDGKTVAIVEVYLDQTETQATVRKDYLAFGAGIAILLILAIAGPALSLVLILRRLREKNQLLKIESARAVAADQAKTEFLANVSHELRTPMNGVMGIAQLLARSGLDDRQRKFVDQLMGSAKRQLKLIEELLLFAQIESGNRQLEIAPFRPADVLDEILGVTTPLVTDKPIVLSASKSNTEDLTVLGDSGAFAQILTNLLGNAVKFTERGDIQVSLWADRSQTPTRIVTTVRDTGPGLSEAEQAAIFDRFVQADNSKERRHGGTGLGLSIVKELVELHGGLINVDSTPGQGSTFTVALQLEEATPEISGIAA